MTPLPDHDEENGTSNGAPGGGRHLVAEPGQPDRLPNSTASGPAKKGRVVVSARLEGTARLRYTPRDPGVGSMDTSTEA